MISDPEKRLSAEEALKHIWLNNPGETQMSGPAVVAEMERRSPMKRTESQTQAVEWDRATPMDSVVNTIQRFVRNMGKTCMFLYLSLSLLVSSFKLIHIYDM